MGSRSTAAPASPGDPRHRRGDRARACTALHTCIQSALSQTHPDVEVVVVEDGSTDGSVNVVRAFGRRVVPVLKPNGGADLDVQRRVRRGQRRDRDLPRLRRPPRGLRRNHGCSTPGRPPGARPIGRSPSSTRPGSRPAP
ncbi:MAG: glycosyltransferase [Actinomycetota bacterium]|nr:glycosyltransferase [Actinomycetota bacterium]